MRSLFLSVGLLLAVLVSGCSSRTYQNSDYVVSKFEKERLAVVVFTMRGKPSFLGGAPRVNFDLVKIDKFFGINDHNPIYRSSAGFLGELNVWNQEYLCLMVEPGFYVIDNITWTEGNTTYYTPSEFVTSRPVKYGAFEVEAGSVNYVGDLEVSSQKGVLTIHRINRFEKAQEALKQKYPELAPHLTQTEFFPSGYSTGLQSKI
jgi:hypothetical protein